ncbi:hypothetical protein GPECTOR_4g612 [Gonium pectorale]|uniref:Peptidase M14 domain-containing protein n=1 Tax=Gonium pectorale TaxID=33097 RepID=A0A150GXD3_GONPE|nr:hypothetical protein GPECTOR_4g612 [Gonium pectorale]|eukprot:KXZ54547.1 hypothetical protein GPECTOR_4g612 [Gonium pectorale]
MSAFLSATAARSGGRCGLSSLGKSVQDRDLWLVTVGNASAPHFPDPAYPSVPYPKPKFVYIGAMHGDETGNLVVLLRLLEELCGDTSRDARVQLYVVPCMNPDGYVLGQRWNAHDVDLNRNAFTDDDFPYARPKLDELSSFDAEAYFFLTAGGTHMEPETQAITSWLSSLRPTLSANLHGGALVASYALDACDSLGRDMSCDSVEAPLPRFLANAYALQHPDMPRSRSDPDGWGRFVNGTTQGARRVRGAGARGGRGEGGGWLGEGDGWYTALGTLADWAHWAMGHHMLTLELHETKDPPPGPGLARLYAANRASLLRLAEMSHLGMRSVVLDAATQAPLAAWTALDGPAGMWPPQADAAGYIWKLGVPGVTYSGVLQPHDPRDPSSRYASIPFRFRVRPSWDAAVRGSGIAELAVVRTLLATRLAKK